mmetsp:Transcript_7053/g.23957  ORF Transcript_7053/g.23957 Transcript_7053/m.23957 type:complete len:96 (+) Transcript_7053:490-777(+)
MTFGNCAELDCARFPCNSLFVTPLQIFVELGDHRTVRWSLWRTAHQTAAVAKVFGTSTAAEGDRSGALDATRKVRVAVPSCNGRAYVTLCFCAMP